MFLDSFGPRLVGPINSVDMGRAQKCRRMAKVIQNGSTSRGHERMTTGSANSYCPCSLGLLFRLGPVSATVAI